MVVLWRRSLPQIQPVSGNQAPVVGDQKCNDRGDIFRTGDVDEIHSFSHVATRILGDHPVSVTGGCKTLAVIPNGASSNAADIE